MEYIRNRSKVDFSEKLNLPKHFEFKVLGSLIQDLEVQVDGSSITHELRCALLADFKKARQHVRDRDVKAICNLANALSTQSMLSKRDCHCNGDAEAFFIQYQLGALLKKYPFKGVDTKRAAMAKFASAERDCFMFNTQNYKAVERLSETCHPMYGNMIDEIRSDIENLLGAIPDPRSVEVGAKHGPGVAVGIGYEGGKSTSYFKWANLPYTVTTGALPLARRAIEHDPRWIGALDDWYRERCDNRYAPIDTNDFWSRVFSIVPGSRITTVPKTALTDRTIAIEPAMNVYLQLGVDHIMKRRLKQRWDMDLTTQAVNQVLAKQGAVDGSYATIDLSAASDTISLKVCEMLFPVAWYSLLHDLRSPLGVVDGSEVAFDKISSMGNGYTFALETIIFGAITRHVMRRLKNPSRIAVYGDDIVVPASGAKDLIDLLQLFGFSINNEKSFIKGPFRESCGSDWFFGYDVRPVFLKRRITNVSDLFYLHNSLFQLERNLYWTWGAHFDATRRLLRNYIPERYKYVFGPPSETLDTHLFSRRRLPGIGQDRWHLCLSVVAKKFNHKTNFLFRKLMSSLKGDDQAHLYAWDKSKRLTTGNSFDVTRRDAVQIRCSKRRVYL